MQKLTRLSRIDMAVAAFAESNHLLLPVAGTFKVAGTPMKTGPQRKNAVDGNLDTSDGKQVFINE